jgi:hypothetical protein
VRLNRQFGDDDGCEFFSNAILLLLELCGDEKGGEQGQDQGNDEMQLCFRSQ